MKVSGVSQSFLGSVVGWEAGARSVLLMTLSALVGTGCVAGATDGEPQAEVTMDTTASEPPGGSEESSLPEPVRTEVPFASLVTQTFRWEDVDYAIEAATIVTVTGEWLSGPYENNWVVLNVAVTNRVNHENSTNLQWDLVLADGTRLEGDAGPGYKMEPLQAGHMTISFYLGSQVNLQGALLQPHDGSLTRYVPLQVPLDAPLQGQYPLILDELNGLIFETQKEDPTYHYRITVLNAEINVDTDFDGGSRADYGKKFLDITLHVHLVDSAVPNDFFAREDVKVVSGGYNASEQGDFDGLERNQAQEFEFLFELEEAATEFTFSINTADDQWREVAVVLPAAGPQTP